MLHLQGEYSHLFPVLIVGVKCTKWHILVTSRNILFVLTMGNGLSGSDGLVLPLLLLVEINSLCSTPGLSVTWSRKLAVCIPHLRLSVTWSVTSGKLALYFTPRTD